MSAPGWPRLERRSSCAQLCRERRLPQYGCPPKLRGGFPSREVGLSLPRGAALVSRFESGLPRREGGRRTEFDRQQRTLQGVRSSGGQPAACPRGPRCKERPAEGPYRPWIAVGAPSDPYKSQAVRGVEGGIEPKFALEGRIRGPLTRNRPGAADHRVEAGGGRDHPAGVENCPKRASLDC